MATTHLKIVGTDRAPQALFSGDSVEIDNTFKQLGGVMNVKGIKNLVIWVNLDVNSSVNVQLRALAGLVDTDVTWEFPIQTVSATKIDIDDEVRELPAADRKVIFELQLDGCIPYIQLFVKDAADGTGQIDSAYVTIGEHI